MPMARIDRWTNPINNTRILPQKKPNNVFNYKDVLPPMVENNNLLPNDFNVNQNYGKKDVAVLLFVEG